MTTSPESSANCWMVWLAAGSWANKTALNIDLLTRCIPAWRTPVFQNRDHSWRWMMAFVRAIFAPNATALNLQRAGGCRRQARGQFVSFPLAPATECPTGNRLPVVGYRLKLAPTASLADNRQLTTGNCFLASNCV